MDKPDRRDFMARGIAAAGALAASSLGSHATANAVPANSEDSARLYSSYLRGRHGQVHCLHARPAADMRFPVLLLHGFPESGRQFARLMPVLCANRRGLAPDLPGYGDSDLPATVPNPGDLALAAGELLDLLETGACDVVGYQGGCAVAVELAIQRPSQIRRVALISAPLLGSSLEQFEERLRPVRLTPDGSHLVQQWQNYLAKSDANLPLEYAAERFVDVVRRPATAWRGLQAMLAQPLASRLAAVRQPLLAMAPEDEFHPGNLGVAMHAPHAQVRPLPGWGHGCMDLHATALAGMLRAFMDAAA